MGKIGVLVVDDSAVYRKAISDALSRDAELEVVGTAANGRIALAALPRLHPDVVLLDIEMPELNGMETLSAIRQTHPTLPVIMFSSLTERGAEATLDALSRGATDYATKPANLGGADAALAYLSNELIPRIKAACGRTRSADRARDGVPGVAVPDSADASRPSSTMPRAQERRVDVVAIGVSTGGPDVLGTVLSGLPPDFPVPIVIVQHLPAGFSGPLAERLDASSTIAVREAVGGEELQPGTAWIAPGDYHLALERRRSGVHLVTHQQAPENYCRPAVDVLFRSVASTCGSHALGVVLTGMGRDGTEGSGQIRSAGGRIIVQDQNSSVVWGMPGSVVQAGLADQVLPLEEIALELARAARVDRTRTDRNGPDRNRPVA